MTPEETRQANNAIIAKNPWGFWKNVLYNIPGYLRSKTAVLIIQIHLLERRKFLLRQEIENLAHIENGIHERVWKWKTTGENPFPMPEIRPEPPTQ